MAIYDQGDMQVANLSHGASEIGSMERTACDMIGAFFWDQ